MGQVTINWSGVPASVFCMILMETLNSGDPLCGSFCGDLLSLGVFSGGLVSRGLLSRANDFGCDRAYACP